MPEKRKPSVDWLGAFFCLNVDKMKDARILQIRSLHYSIKNLPGAISSGGQSVEDSTDISMQFHYNI